MELREFISQALIDIIGGVTDAQKEITNGEIVPKLKDSYQSVELGISNIQAISFDVSVTVEKKSGSGAKISVISGLIGGKITGDLSKTASNISKLSFKVPIKFAHENSEK